MSLLLGVNIDHVATLRQARYAQMLDSPNAEPSPLESASDALVGGADSITRRDQCFPGQHGEHFA